MPFMKKKKGAAAWAKKKAGFRKRRAGGRRMVNVNRALQPIPQRYICSMKYSTTVGLSPLTSTWRFNLNSIYDPDRSGAGFQPYSHDTLQTLYNRYRVIACSWVITGYNGSSGIRVVALPSNEEVGPGNLSEAVTNPRAKYIVQYPGGNTNKLRGRVYMPSLVGRNKSQYMADDRYQAQFGANPVELAVLNVYGATLLDGAIDGTHLTVELTYTVECFDVKNLPVS